jgi:hypothetical protein
VIDTTAVQQHMCQDGYQIQQGNKVMKPALSWQMLRQCSGVMLIVNAIGSSTARIRQYDWLRIRQYNRQHKIRTVTDAIEIQLASVTQR